MKKELRTQHIHLIALKHTRSERYYFSASSIQDPKGTILVLVALKNPAA